MKITECRHLSFYDARELAISENWFTLASNEIYSLWLESCELENLTPHRLYTLASTVYEYSELPIASEYTKEEVIENIMFIMAKKANTYFNIE